MGIVAPNYTAWSQRYPEFVANAAAGQVVEEPLYAAYFAEACLYVDNTVCSPVPNEAPTYQRAQFLGMIVSHIAALNRPGSSGIVGRIASATEGTVTVAAEYGQLQPGSQAWYIQTKYGAAFWQASGDYRRAIYVPAPVTGPFVGINSPYGVLVGLRPPWLL